MRKAMIVLGLCALAGSAQADPINTSNAAVYAAFAQGATVQTFEGVGTPLSLTSYANTTNATLPVPAGALLQSQLGGLHFHSGGASFNNPAANPGTPAALLSLEGGLAGARSGTAVFGALQITSDPSDPTLLDLDAFVEIIFTGGNVNRVGFWLNPLLGDVLLTAFDATGAQLESVQGTAGNFVGITRLANDIRFVSIVALTNGVGFTGDDLTYGVASTQPPPPRPADAPATALLLLAGVAALGAVRRRC